MIMDDKLRQLRRFIATIEDGQCYSVYQSNARSHSGLPIYIAEPEADPYGDFGFLVLTDEEADLELYYYLNNATLDALEQLSQYELYDLVIYSIDDDLKDMFNKEVKQFQDREKLYPVTEALTSYLPFIDKGKLAEITKEKYGRAQFLSEDGYEGRMGDYYIYQLWGGE